MDPSLPLSRPKRVTAAQQPQFFPTTDLPWPEHLKPIWGHAVRALFDGGRFDPTKPAEQLLNARGGPRQPQRGKEFYPSEFHPDEPDPEVSSRTVTGELVRAMWRAGWARELIEHTLCDRVHDGGLYYRWRISTDTDPTAFLDYLWEQTPLTETDPYYLQQVQRAICNSGAGGTAITSNTQVRRKPYVFKPVPRDEGRILRWLSEHPGEPQQHLIDAKLVHGREIRKYLDSMEAEGLIRFAFQKIPGAQGRPRKVWEVIPAEPVNLV